MIKAEKIGLDNMTGNQTGQVDSLSRGNLNGSCIGWFAEVVGVCACRISINPIFQFSISYQLAKDTLCGG